MKNTIRFYLILFVYVLTSFFLSSGLESCGSASSQDGDTSENTSREQARIAAQANGFSPILYNLVLTEQDFRYLSVKTEDTSQIALEFCVRKDSSKFTLKAYPGKNDNRLDTDNHRFLKPLSVSQYNLASGDALFPIQKLNRNNIRKIYERLTPDTLDQVLVFFPQIKNNGKLQFEIVVFKASEVYGIEKDAPATADPIATNPSPPGRFRLATRELE